MLVTRNDQTNITPNFKVSEFYSTSPDAPKSHFIDDRLPQILEAIRTFYGVPVRITSSFRTQRHQHFLTLNNGGAKNSYHCKGLAIDFEFAKNESTYMNMFSNEVRKRGQLWQKLRSLGLSGIGLYGGFIHIDVRPEAGNQKDHFGTFAFWDKQLTQKKKTVHAS